VRSLTTLYQLLKFMSLTVRNSNITYGYML
jgi:hypothetical protein